MAWALVFDGLPLIISGGRDTCRCERTSDTSRDRRSYRRYTHRNSAYPETLGCTSELMPTRQSSPSWLAQLLGDASEEHEGNEQTDDAHAAFSFPKPFTFSVGVSMSARIVLKLLMLRFSFVFGMLEQPMVGWYAPRLGSQHEVQVDLVGEYETEFQGIRRFWVF